MKFLLLQSLRLASQATSLYTREAHYRPTVHLKGFDFYIDWVENVDEDRIEEVLREEFGRYYDSLRPITITDKYTEVNHWGHTEQYALIDLDDFMAFIKDAREEIVPARK